ncbi:MAG: hypothetical protein AAB913_02945 [Patescibacteria group bacterium]
MENEDLIKEIKKRYNEALEKNHKSYSLGLYKDKGLIFIEINNVEYSITRQILADKPSGVGDELANKIWNWIQK